MKNLAIQAENISKQYRLGEVGTGTISHDLNRFWARVRGKEDPFLKIGENNDRSKKGESDYVWSLKDINFEIEQGDAVGIIGRNGAGKSTLLKLLSKVTKPTTGSFKVNGRIASLLEVGTGFNPEMTGRENIYLNGAILGMRRQEITRKFDEIVDFSGVERYIDTPVKRYSSGMYVRLAFAVAAHLESEILIVDEVLAVGDAEFQKKCLGKMKHVSNVDGRTVLFVSHDMSAIKRLSDKIMILEKGQLFFIGQSDDAINKYLEIQRKKTVQYCIQRDEIKDKELYFTNIKLSNVYHEETNEFFIDEKIRICINIESYLDQEKFEDISILIIIQDHLRRKIFSCINNNIINKGEIELIIESNQLTRGTYSINAIVYRLGVKKFHEVEECCDFSVLDVGSQYDGLDTFDYGVMFGQYQWK